MAEYQIKGNRAEGFDVYRVRKTLALTHKEFLFTFPSLAECVRFLRKEKEKEVQNIVDEWAKNA